jgi:hypothetical protein
MCSKEIGLCAQNMINVLNSTVIIIGENMYDHLTSMPHIFNLKLNKITLTSSKNCEESGSGLNFGFANYTLKLYTRGNQSGHDITEFCSVNMDA